MDGFCFAQLFAQAAPADGGSGPFQMLPALAAIGILFYVMMIRPERRKQAEHKALVDAVKKNDRVLTVGGIYGVVTNVQRDSDRVTIRVDEQTNTKLDITVGSIARVIVDEPAIEKTIKTA